MTRDEYINLFDDMRSALEHEERCLSIGREFLPQAVIDVLDNHSKEPDGEYWDWLSSQLDDE